MGFQISIAILVTAVIEIRHSTVLMHQPFHLGSCKNNMGFYYTSHAF